MDKLEIYNKCREVPQEAQKPIQGGRLKGKTDINPMWRLKKLTELFGPCGIGWYYKTTRKWTEAVGDEVAAFVDIELFVKQEDVWSMPICGTGGSMLATKEKGGVYVSDECYKMATTDAISVACKQLGIGANIYWAADRTKYDRQQELENFKQASPQRQSPKQPFITPKEIKALCNEVDRIGWDTDKLLAWLKVDSFEHITMEKYEFAMIQMRKREDKIPESSPNDPPIILEDEGLPFK